MDTDALSNDDSSRDDYEEGDAEESESEEITTNSDQTEDDLAVEVRDLKLDNRPEQGVAPANVIHDQIIKYWQGKPMFTRVLWIYAWCPARIGSWQQAVSVLQQRILLFSY